eukprot:4740833-Amphidinium_carterae.1
MDVFLEVCAYMDSIAACSSSSANQARCALRTELRWQASENFSMGVCALAQGICATVQKRRSHGIQAHMAHGRHVATPRPIGAPSWRKPVD